jgi:spore germination protein KA
MLEFLQSSEDYYHHFIISSLMRILRYVSVFITLLAPALFVTVTTFHQEIIPAPLLISIAAQREGVPFPAFLEVLLLELTFEILREAGIRMPRAVGSAISIVGALVLGQAAVEAGLISAAVVIVVSITAITSFVITNYGMSNAIRLLRFVFIFLAGTLGLYGITIGLIILCLHMCSLKSATVPYLLPYGPYNRGDKKDGLVRFPLRVLKQRPEGISASAAPRASGQSTVDPGVKERPEFQ